MSKAGTALHAVYDQVYSDSCVCSYLKVVGEIADDVDNDGWQKLRNRLVHNPSVSKWSDGQTSQTSQTKPGGLES